MYINTLTISSKGQIVLPKKVRDIFKSNVVTLEVNDNNQLILSPVYDLGGVLSIYRKDSELSFDEIRQQAWIDNRHT
ncbi:MAG: AbrB/MazE/SpoVT family DNA-binding domain-containing protein [Rickettsia endosymbiont of Pseudomimeciton antennatum]|jgi:bifunctional DNA-binding transcriptional regulator/antitoxin component of YhaV-PrlF toxin-antitoxin module|nr:AbrB/MazE/SpoVT family DNA-binding domain-containing protein [Rickettsia endosymbiont of Pseudomimeciton antennatum]MCC8398714.1 AbrB/MazE/SpoVT family DNA-binding domain-containing protein [Rickettsia endosymbiont of Labidopullus appendiculatus]